VCRDEAAVGAMAASRVVVVGFVVALSLFLLLPSSLSSSPFDVIVACYLSKGFGLKW
jgi:hypothetical protein